MQKIISLHLIFLIVIIFTLAYIYLRHRFFLGPRKAMLLAFAAFLLCAVGERFLPPEEPDTIFTLQNSALPLLYLFGATTAPVVAIRFYRNWRDVRSGKVWRDYNEDR